MALHQTTRPSLVKLYRLLAVSNIHSLRPVLLCASCFLFLPSIAGAQISLKMLEHNGTRFAAYVDVKTGTPTWVVDVDSLDFTLGGMSSLSSAAAVSAAARAFLTAHQQVFRIHPDQLASPDIRSNDRMWFISYPQQHAKLPVLHAEVGITITRDGRIVALGIRAFPRVDVQISPQATLLSAIQSALRRAARTDASAAEDSRLVIVPTEQQDRYVFTLAWQIRLDTYDPANSFNRTYLIDAQTAAVIREDDNILEHGYEDRHAAFSLPAKSVPYFSGSSGTERNAGYFMTSTMTTGGNSVGGYVTLNYYETPDDYTNPFVRHISQPFSGAKVVIENDMTGGTHTTYANGSGYYSFSELDSGSHTLTFDIATSNFYISYGLDADQKKKNFSINVSGKTKYDHDWGWGDSGDGGITSYALNGVHHGHAMQNYFYDTYGHDMSHYDFLFHMYSYSEGRTGSGTSNSFQIKIGGIYAMSSEVTYHEYAHDVIHDIYEGWIGGDGAMDEALADYFAADITGDHTYGGPQPDADPYAPAGEGVVIRFLHNSCTMDDYNGPWPCGSSPHSRGRILSGALWDLRSAIGTEASHILFDALQMAPRAHSFSELRDNYLAVDRVRNNGANAVLIEQTFYARKIGTPIAPGIPFITFTSSGDPRLTWTDNSATEEGYRIERRINSGSWIVIAALPSGSTQYTDETYKQCTNTVYEYRIQAYNSVGPSVSPIGEIINCDTLYGIVRTSSLTNLHDSTAPEEEIIRTGLEPIYPNPGNAVVIISYALEDASPTQLSVYDVTGREVTVLTNLHQNSGRHEMHFDTSGLPVGVYVVRLVAGSRHFSQPVILAR